MQVYSLVGAEKGESADGFAVGEEHVKGVLCLCWRVLEGLAYLFDVEVAVVDDFVEGVDDFGEFAVIEGGLGL